MPVPKTLPVWFLPLTRRKYGLGPRPSNAPPIKPGGKYQWVLDEWAKFDKWYAWRKKGGKRPTGIWTTVPAWAWVIARELGRKDHSDPQPVQKWPLRSSPTVGRAGLYFYTYVNSQIPEARLIELCRQYDLWVALLVHELDRPPNPTYDTEAQRRRLQSQGITVVASGWVEAGYDLDKQAEAAAHYSQGYEEYIANAEYSWSWMTPGFAASKEFCPKLRRAFGAAMPFRLSIMWGEVIDLKPWLDAGIATVSPQCYMNEWPHQNPVDAVHKLAQPQAELPYGIPAKMVEPTYGNYGSHPMPMVGYATPHAGARTLGVVAASTWAAEYASEADIPVLANMSR